MSRSPAPFFTADDRAFLGAVARAGNANPFAPARVEAERAALGPLFADPTDAMTPRGAPPARHPNLRHIAARLVPILDGARARLAAGAAAENGDLALYQDASLYLLHDTHDERLQPIVDGRAPASAAAGLYRALLDDHDRLLRFPGSPLRPPRPPHVFACAYQMRRAFHQIFSTLIGTSRPMAELRAAVWSAVFTRDQGAYLRSCDQKSSDVATLVTGPSGTGKELVAQVVGRSRHVAFDAEQGRFVADQGADFCAVDLSALPDALFESELFGHERGAFTGAVKDRKGVFEAVRAGGAVFLDEIGELPPDRQVKLLRVLESRVFHRVGDTGEHSFSARVVSATHRDMGERIRASAFRLDLYQRLAGLRIVTPSLRDQLDAAPGDLALLVGFFARRVAAEDAAQALAEDTLRYIEAHLARYAWPGNARELAHCVESVHHAGAFVPLDLEGDEDPLRSLREGKLSEDEAMHRYRALVYKKAGSVAEAARRLGIHRSTLGRSLDRSRPSRRGPARPR